MRRAVATLGAATLVLPGFAALVATAPPAAASTQSVIHLKPNQTVTITNPGFPVGTVGPLWGILNGPPQPADCADDGTLGPICDTFPIRLDDGNGKPLSDKALQNRLFSVTYTLSWNTTNIDIPSSAPQPTNQYELAVWDDPVVKDDDPQPCDPNGAIVNFYICSTVDGGSSGGAPGGDEPYYDSLSLQAQEPELYGMVPKRDNYAATVWNTFGVATPYTLKVSLIEASGNPEDLSVDKAVADLSNDNGPTSPSASPDSALPSLAKPTSPGFDLGIAPGGADSDLDSLQSAGGPDLDLNGAAANIVRNAGARTIGAPTKASPFLMVLSLVLVPALIVGGLVAWFLRRRATFISV